MTQRVGSRRGQSILEYLVIATVIVASIVAIRAGVAKNMNELYSGASDQTKAAAANLQGLNLDGSGTPPATPVPVGPPPVTPPTGGGGPDSH